jgi:hypothetical protein
MDWRRMVLGFEQDLVLFNHEQKSLTNQHWQYLHQRTNGSIGELKNLISLAAIEAIGPRADGTEAITIDILEKIPLSFSVQQTQPAPPTKRPRKKGSA